MNNKIINTPSRSPGSPRGSIFIKYSNEFDVCGLATTILGKDLAKQAYLSAIRSIKKDIDEYNKNNNGTIKLIGLTGSYTKDNMRIGLYPMNINYEDAVEIDKEKIELSLKKRRAIKANNAKYLKFPSDIDLVIVPDPIEKEFISQQEKLLCAKIFNEYGVYVTFTLPILSGTDYTSIDKFI